MSRYFNTAALEKELRTLQHELSPSEARTSLFNLVVFVPRDRSAYLDEALQYLVGKRPGRIIIVRLGGRGSTTASASARCVEDQEDRQICLQELIIDSGEDRGGEDPGTWTPLLLKDIPVFALWMADLPADPAAWLALFDDQPDRILLDSRLSGPSEAFFRGLSGFSGYSLGDLAWSRLLPIQKLTANLFNPLELRPALHRLVEVELTGGTAAEAFWYTQWLASRMSWRRSEDGLLRNGNGEEVLVKHLKPAALEKGFQLRFRSALGDTFGLESTDQGYAVSLPPGREKYTSVFHIPQEGEILLREVDQTNQERLFAEALAHLRG